MVRLRRCGLPLLGALLAALALTTAVSAETKWPSMLNYSVGVSSDETAKIQMSASLSGPLNEEFGAKVGGWWITGGSDNRAFVGDAYIDYHKGPLYIAGGRKFVPFGPTGILVSPGITGGEVQYAYDRVELRAISGTLSFTPVTGGSRFTFAGNRSPADTPITAARVAVKLTEPGSETPAVLGINALRLLHHTGYGGDLAVETNKWLTLYAETARFEGIHASNYGVRLSNQKLQEDPSRYTMLVLYHRRVPVNFAPAVVGATAYFEGQIGWVAGVYHQFNPRYGVGLYADEDNAILTLFGNVPLK